MEVCKDLGTGKSSEGRSFLFSHFPLQKKKHPKKQSCRASSTGPKMGLLVEICMVGVCLHFGTQDR